MFSLTENTNADLDEMAAEGGYETGWHEFLHRADGRAVRPPYYLIIRVVSIIQHIWLYRVEPGAIKLLPVRVQAECLADLVEPGAATEV